MKNLLFCFLLFTTFISNAQTIKLNYIPKGQIIKFTLNNITIITDTTALFSVTDYRPYVTDSNYLQRIRILLTSKKENDTIEISNPFVSFNDSINIPNETYWRIWLSIRILTKENKVVIINSNGNIIRKIKLINEGDKNNCFACKVFIDKMTNEKLFVYEYRRICLGILYQY
ncbi:MAG: hypothetical protein CVU05_15115 [Bacteroidetes bacterium HGW-Bacteroidetes-21]|jgi:hypothetical protein|nr:MAG: hypothetical protein CVU05_15115 [Bacteroidetes bacterium HGW-Bacteroidetes-21]